MIENYENDLCLGTHKQGVVAWLGNKAAWNTSTVKQLQVSHMWYILCGILVMTKTISQPFCQFNFQEEQSVVKEYALGTGKLLHREACPGLMWLGSVKEMTQLREKK